MFYNNCTRMNFMPFHAKTINARTIHHIERFMVIEICPNMLLRGQKTTGEHARMSFHILRVTITKRPNFRSSVHVKILRRL